MTIIIYIYGIIIILFSMVEYVFNVAPFHDSKLML